ncbi:oligosaccharide flippase family protein [Tenacibaculum ascidiaceicola]|uniref:oligosaccharide flippase family protein n=1 Tax=Tenacibaculum ascidiaceicola TaxID=1699411 RepID=UPI0039E4508A
MNIPSFKNILKNQKVLIANYSYLGLLQIINLLIPLATYPYLIQTLGKQLYGKVIYSQAIIGYLVILVNFGFNISATKEVSIHRENKHKITEIVSSVFQIKFAFLILTIIILTLALFFLNLDKEFHLLLYLTMWLCLYEFIFPVWYFQGLEEMKYITLITLSTRLLFLGLIFVFINSKEDYLLLPIISGIGAVLAGLISIYIVFIKHKVGFKIQKLDVLLYHIKEALPIFISNVSIRLYVSSNKVILGSFLGMTEVAYYDLAEKIVSILKMPQSILSRVLFPKISREKNMSFVKKVFKFSIGLNLFLYLCLFFLAEFLILLLGGEEMSPSLHILLILGITIPLVGIGNTLGVQVLIPLGYSKIFSKVIVSSGVLYSVLVTTLIISNNITILNLTILTVLIEVFVVFYMFLFSIRKKLWTL